MSKLFQYKRSQWYLYALILLLIPFVHTETVQAKVRPSDINYPTDDFGLGRGYAPPGAIFNVNVWGGGGGSSEPYVASSQSGFFFNARSPFESGELGVSFGMFNHSYEDQIEIESGTYATNLVIDWCWRGGHRRLHDPYFGLGIALPTRKLTGEGGFEGEAQLDAFHIALASRFGGQNRWIWEPNSASAFFETGGRANWGQFIIEGDLGVAYLYRMATSNVIESANLFIQSSAALGFQGDHSGLTVGGGYAIAPLSLADDVDQMNLNFTYSYVNKAKEYYIKTYLPLDAPTGILSDRTIVTVIVGIQGQL